jgi:hypothetical protein
VLGKVLLAIIKECFIKIEALKRHTEDKGSKSKNTIIVEIK